MGKRNHIHKYKKVKLGKGKDYVVYACALPDCTHYLAAELIVGKESICWRCGEKFLINQRNKDLYKPHCRNCTRGKDENLPTSRPRVGQGTNINFGDILPKVPKL